MNDIFLSYASEDRERARSIVRIFEKDGRSVWWDRQITPGKSFDREIDRAIVESRCVVVLWSRHSVDSDWVNNEALEGLERGILIPVLLDDVRLSIGFKRTNVVRLVDWPARADQDEIDRLRAAVSDVLSQDALTPSTPASRFAVTARSIAVMPFQEAGRSPKDEDYLADGIADEIIAVLSRNDDLRVANRTAMAAFKNSDIGAVEIGHALKVDTVLAGSIRHAGDKVRIDAELVDVGNGIVLWSVRLDSSTDDIFETQDNLARSIADSLKFRMVGDAPARDLSLNADVNDLLLKARYYFSAHTSTNLERATRLYQKALELEPKNVSALCGLADANLQCVLEDIYVPLDAYPKVERLLDNALVLDPNNARALGLKGALLAYCYWDWQQSGEHFARSLEIDPRDTYVRYLYAHCYLLFTGRRRLALRHAHHMETIDPDSTQIKMMHAWLLHIAGEWTQCVEKCEEVERLQPQHMSALVTRGWCLARLGQSDDCHAIFREIDRLYGFGGTPAYVHYLLTGDTNQLLRHHRFLLRQLQETGIGATDLARACIDLDNPNEGLDWIAQAAERREPLIAARMFDFIELSRHPRFEEIQISMGLDATSLRLLYESEPRVPLPTH